MAIYFDETIQSYLDWLKNVKRAPYHTYRAYNIDLLQFLRYFLRNEKNELPSKDEISEYVAEIKKKYNYATYRRKITAIRNFITFLIDSGINMPDPLISISLPVPDIDYNLSVTYEDVLEFISKLPEDSKNEIRDKLLFCLTAKSGLTIKQLRSLKLKDINLASNQIIISKNQMTFIDSQTNALIEKYLSILKDLFQLGLEDFLLANEERIPFSERTINLIIDKTSQRYNFKIRLSPTVLRRLFAKSLTEKNINKETKEMILGKKSRLAV